MSTPPTRRRFSLFVLPFCNLGTLHVSPSPYRPLVYSHPLYYPVFAPLLSVFSGVIFLKSATFPATEANFMTTFSFNPFCALTFVYIFLFVPSTAEGRGRSLIVLVVLFMLLLF